jgi:hypothetical protein
MIEANVPLLPELWATALAPDPAPLLEQLVMLLTLPPVEQPKRSPETEMPASPAIAQREVLSVDVISTVQLRGADGALLVLEGGDGPDVDHRYLELHHHTGTPSVRATWTASGTRDGDMTAEGFRFQVSVNHGSARSVALKQGLVYEEGSAEPLLIEELNAFGNILARLGVRDAAIPPEALRLSLGRWASCMSDFAGAGAGIGSLIGGASGRGWVGAGQGAIVGGALGGAFGLGWCTMQEIFSR